MSKFVVSARKYRPAKFSDVVGQQHVSQTLKNALQNDKLAHAFLFCGPRGVGKTTCARILAKVLNCQNLSADHEPCNECSSCQAFNENASFNITELDAASNNSVEHIRALIEQVRFQPQQGKFKVFIIDEVHMLSQQAFNAFLKTLEEPPSYAIFILATTEKHKIIPTILSRCQIFDFKRIQVPDMVAHLQNICQEEGIDANKDALHIIAQKADGALRDALSIFDRIVSFSGKSIKYEDVISNLNVLDYDYYFKVVDALVAEDISQVLLILDDVMRKGFDPDIFINGLAEHLRNLLVCKDEQTLSLLELSENLKVKYLEQARLVPSSLVLTALNLANDCDINYKMARNKRLHVEMALIKMAYINRAVQIAGTSPGVSPEKKTPDSSVGELEVADNEQVVSGSKIAEEKQRVPKVTNEATPEPSKAKEEEPSIPKAPSLMPSAGLDLPQVKGLDALLAEVKADEEQKEELEDVELTKELAQEHWNAYIESCEQETVKSILRLTEVAIEGEHTIVAIVGSALSEKTIRQEKRLMEFLRASIKMPNLILQVVVDRSKAPEAPKRQKPLTPKEKFLKMRETNPAIQELQKRFDLRVDNS